ncbi:GNAT family N-acetyltransferase [Macrococcus equipercicus]|uniref:GNAT family N-acetyltransferase n=1 Tax=Macrococcus equipercicus TaxID=69967 RepID=A0A9Q9BPI1_9STAP|nr:GNAT family N-acetyltransferase [Macrococcus equipercicus]KAA1039998.1 GNAT family N-acetyltransferase [Macrococcus equipercicus]UTH13069.1 GNAT family N-acetyltransferase [Macrococcus equipercicus]
MEAIEIRPMTRSWAEQIGGWDFGEGYEFYNIEGDLYIIEEFLNGHYYAAFCDDELIGFFCDGEMATVAFDYDIITDCLDIGLALRPDLTSQGYGRQLMAALMEFYRNMQQVNYFRLTVAAFNSRAVRLYERMGFQHVQQFEVVEGNERLSFYIMLLEVPS